MKHICYGFRKDYDKKRAPQIVWVLYQLKHGKLTVNNHYMCLIIHCSAPCSQLHVCNASAKGVQNVTICIWQCFSLPLHRSK